jgi:4-amino-4-deoxy-L-arabinose transferase-like glycosyltransferase
VSLPSARLKLTGVALAALLLAGLLVRLPAISGPLLDFAPARETYDALRARIIYLDGERIPMWQRAVLDRDRREVPQIEPPVMEHLAVLSYRIAGGEKTWIPRLFSVLFWLMGGMFLYRLARRVAADPGPLIATAIYLLCPFSIFASRSFQPDPLMVMLTLAAVLAIVRFHERPGPERLAAAAGLSALAALSKPPIPIFFLWGVYLALAISRDGLRRGLTRRWLIVFGLVSFAPALAYYVWGIYVRGFLHGHTESSLQPQLWFTADFWRAGFGWLRTSLSIQLPDCPTEQHC